MIKKREFCLYCNEKMESKTAKKKFCSDLHRLYYNRELKRGTLSIDEHYKEEKLSKFITYKKSDESSYDEQKNELAKFDELGIFCSTPKQNYDFKDDKYLMVEKYTSYPLKNKPTNNFEQIKWLKEKKESDNQIKFAWEQFKKTIIL